MALSIGQQSQLQLMAFWEDLAMVCVCDIPRIETEVDCELCLGIHPHLSFVLL